MIRVPIEDVRVGDVVLDSRVVHIARCGEVFIRLHLANCDTVDSFIGHVIPVEREG